MWRRRSKYLEKAKRDIGIFDEVEPEPSKETVEKGAKIISEFSPDWIVGLGGGSCIDAAKAMWVLYERPDLKVDEIAPVIDLNLRRRARLIPYPHYFRVRFRGLLDGCHY